MYILKSFTQQWQLAQFIQKQHIYFLLSWLHRKVVKIEYIQFFAFIVTISTEIRQIKQLQVTHNPSEVLLYFLIHFLPFTYLKYLNMGSLWYQHMKTPSTPFLPDDLKHQYMYMSCNYLVCKRFKICMLKTKTNELLCLGWSLFERLMKKRHAVTAIRLWKSFDNQRDAFKIS